MVIWPKRCALLYIFVSTHATKLPTKPNKEVLVLGDRHYALADTVSGWLRRATVSIKLVLSYEINFYYYDWGIHLQIAKTLGQMSTRTHNIRILKTLLVNLE